jgi:hypothetical protein
MARIFTISFDFRHQHHTALVTSGCGTNGSTNYTVALTDEELQHMLPGGKVSFNNIADLQQLAQSQPKLQELMHSIAMALCQKLEPTLNR